VTVTAPQVQSQGLIQYCGQYHPTRNQLGQWFKISWSWKWVFTMSRTEMAVW